MSRDCVDTTIVPNELVMEILSRVPVKDLMRFRCVSKFWNSLPIDPIFIKLHLQRSLRDTPILIKLPTNMRRGHLSSQHCSFSIQRLLENPLSAFDDDGGAPSKRRYFSIGVCNGLVCLRGIRKESGNNVLSWVRFWNPATRFISKKSPVLLETFSGWAKMGFGYDDSTDTYKVIATVVHRVKKIGWKLELKGYSLGDHCWRNIALIASDTHSGFPCYILQRKGEYLNGTLNWVAEMSTSEQKVIFSFDVRNETYRCLTLPNGVRFGDGWRFKELKVFRGRICVSHIQDGIDYSLWQMNRFGDEKSWSQLFKVGFNLLQFPRHCPSYHFPCPLCISADGNELLLVNNQNFQLIYYNRRVNTIKHVITPHKFLELISTDYVQSLVLPYRN